MKTSYTDDGERPNRVARIVQIVQSIRFQTVPVIQSFQIYLNGWIIISNSNLKPTKFKLSNTPPTHNTTHHRSTALKPTCLQPTIYLAQEVPLSSEPGLFSRVYFQKFLSYVSMVTPLSTHLQDSTHSAPSSLPKSLQLLLPELNDN